jgi:hypothetical protein
MNQRRVGGLPDNPRPITRALRAHIRRIVSGTGGTGIRIVGGVVRHGVLFMTKNRSTAVVGNTLVFSWCTIRHVSIRHTGLQELTFGSVLTDWLQLGIGNLGLSDAQRRLVKAV